MQNQVYHRYYQIDETQTGLVGTQYNDSWDVDNGGSNIARQMLDLKTELRLFLS